jgi:murein L,D-transpeptidase YafK
MAHTRRIFTMGAMSALTLFLAGCAQYTGRNRYLVPLSTSALATLSAIGSSPSEPLLMRIFKESSELEIWKRTTSGRYALFRTYKICAWSGVLGPKLVEGDRQAPEGFYTVTPNLMNPQSALYLSFNTGFPNAYDRARGRTGTNLMVHGACSSAGCYSMTDDQIKEIYAIARESFAGGNEGFQLQMYPFRMTAENLVRHSTDPNIAFWRNLKDGFDLFERNGYPPVWDVCGIDYVFENQGPSANYIHGAIDCAKQRPRPNRVLSKA